MSVKGAVRKGRKPVYERNARPVQSRPPSRVVCSLCTESHFTAVLRVVYVTLLRCCVFCVTHVRHERVEPKLKTVIRTAKYCILAPHTIQYSTVQQNWTRRGDAADSLRRTAHESRRAAADSNRRQYLLSNRRIESDRIERATSVSSQ